MITASIMQANSIPPVVTRGESHDQARGEVLVDTLSVTLPRRFFEELSGYADATPIWDCPAIDNLHIYQGFLDYVFGFGVFEVDEVRAGRNFFKHSITLKNKHGFIAFGGNNAYYDSSGDVVKQLDEKMQFYLTSEGCANITDWQYITERLKETSANITRIDIAYDAHDGHVTVDSIRQAYADNQFTSTGRPPKAQYIDDCGSGDGRTFYVGNRENGKFFRCYEKGKQLGDVTSPWVRLEVEFKSKDRFIPLDILVNPKPYIAGAYPVLSFINLIREVIATTKLKLQISYFQLVKHCRNHYGKLINFSLNYLGLAPDQIILDMKNPSGYPSRLAIST